MTTWALNQELMKNEASYDINDDKLIDNQCIDDEITNDNTNKNEEHQYDANRKEVRTKFLQACTQEE